MHKKDEKQLKKQPKEQTHHEVGQSLTPAQIQQQYAHAQSILMLTQLNSAYYKMHLTLLKTMSNMENRYHAIKIAAFLAIVNYKDHLYEARIKHKVQNYPQIAEYSSIFSQHSHKEISSLSKIKSKQSIIVQQTIHETQSKVILKSKEILTRMVKIIVNKVSNTKCFSFYQLLKMSNQSSTLKILSDKSSKIQTIDSHKNKIFKRSSDKKITKKSFSMEKSLTNHQSFIPIKYQASKASTPVMSSSQSSRIDEPIIQEAGMTGLAKLLLQKHSDSGRRNLLSTNRQRKPLKMSSSKKYNATVFVDGKDEKLRELDYLQKKYKKLITQFNWFSERFLKVIEEEAI